MGDEHRGNLKSDQCLLNSKAQQGFREQRNKEGISIETRDGNGQWHCGSGFASGTRTRRGQPEKRLRRGVLGRVWQRPAFKEAILEGYKYMRMFFIQQHFQTSLYVSKR